MTQIIYNTQKWLSNVPYYVVHGQMPKRDTTHAVLSVDVAWQCIENCYHIPSNFTYTYILYLFTYYLNHKTNVISKC